MDLQRIPKIGGGGREDFVGGGVICPQSRGQINFIREIRVIRGSENFPRPDCLASAAQSSLTRSRLK
jgi:hypothetical protein